MNLFEKNVARVETLFAHQVHNVSLNTTNISRILCFATDSYFVLFPCHVVTAMFLCYDVFFVLKFFPCCLFCHVLDSLFALMHLSCWICCNNVFHIIKYHFDTLFSLSYLAYFSCNAVFVILFPCCILCHVSDRHFAMLFCDLRLVGLSAHTMKLGLLNPICPSLFEDI